MEQPNSRIFPSRDQLGQGAQRLGHRGLLVRRVQLVEVDVVGAQPLQAVLEGGADVGRRGPALVPLVGDAELGGQHDLVAPGPERGAEVGLALGAPVDVGGVEEGDAGIERGTHDGVGLLATDAHAEVVAAQPDHADGERADGARVHVRSSDLAGPMQGHRVGSSVPAAQAGGASGRRREENDMAEGAVDVTVDAAPDAVWANGGRLRWRGQVLPRASSPSGVEGDDRIIGMFGMEIRERLVSRDDAARTLTYSVVEGVPIESHTATISVEAEGDGSKVTWAYDVEPAEMAPIFGDTYKGALAAVEAAFTKA